MPSRRLSRSVPQTLAEADVCALELGRRRQQAQEKALKLEEKIRQLREVAALSDDPNNTRIEQLEEDLQSFAEAHRDELTEGKSKTIVLPSGGELQWRNKPPELAVSHNVTLKTIIATLEKRGYGRFVRVKKELDKNSLKREPELVKTIRGLSIEQHEQFIIKT